MKKLALALAAVAALGLAAPISANASSTRLAQTTTTVVATPAAKVFAKKTVRHHSAMRHGCSMEIVKKHRGHHVIVTKVRRCR